MKISNKLLRLKQKLLLKEKRCNIRNKRYNRDLAKHYAEEYAEKSNVRAYPVFKENDCTNFVSQALNAGGIDMAGERYDSYEDWFCYTKDDKQLRKISLTWRSAIYFRKYWGNNNGIGYNKAKIYKELKVNYILEHFDEIYAMLEIGDVIQYGDIDKNNEPYHTQIIHEKGFNVSINRNDLFVAQHSVNRKNVSLYDYLKLLQNKDRRVVYIYHI
ncbi:MAG: amidase domain-containing protein [Clostridium sp.]